MAERQVKLAAEYQEATARWVKDFVVEYNICPFAKRKLERGSIYYQVVMGTQPEALLQSLLLECLRLDQQPEIETSLVIMPELEDFEDYLDVLDWAEQLLQQQGYEGVYQLASFHPDYCFAGAAPNDASNYTNRAPYATLHLIREQTISRLTALHPDPESIPERNIALTEKLGISSLKQLLAACKGQLSAKLCKWTKKLCELIPMLREISLRSCYVFKHYRGGEGHISGFEYSATPSGVVNHYSRNQKG